MNNKKTIKWKNNVNKKSKLPTFLKRIFSKKNSLKTVHVFPNTIENVEVRKNTHKAKHHNINSNSNNNNNTRKIFFSTPKNLRRAHYRDKIAKTLYKGKYFVE